MPPKESYSQKHPQDPASQNAAYTSEFSIRIGRILDVQMPTFAYLVRIAGMPDLICIDISGIRSPMNLGPREIGAYPPGTSVMVALANATPVGYIICAVVTPLSSGALRSCDWTAPYSGADPFNALAYSSHFAIYADQDYDYNRGQPGDVVPGSDRGLINELGVGYGLSRFFSWTRASDIAGLWCFYHDNLVRLAAYNYEFWHSGGERWIKNDGGEVNDVDLMTPYPWEASGMAYARTNPFVTVSTGGHFGTGQKSLQLEPSQEDQLVLPRLVSLRGYLGDLHRTMVVMPFRYDRAHTEGAGSAEAYKNETVYMGLSDVHQHSDGLVSVRSARGIIHEKYVFIPVPKQLTPPESEADSDYKPAGKWRSPEVTDKTHAKQAWTFMHPDRPDLWGVELYDFLTHTFNWYGLKSVLAHTGSWYVPEEGYLPDTNSDTALTRPTGTTAPVTSSVDFQGAYVPAAALTTTFVFPLPKFAELQIDHRNGSSRYYSSRSAIAQMPDGSILIEDGYGSSIHMAGGNIQISCPGDIWFRPGRSFVAWAPDDAVIKAGSSVDITASRNDVRIKADNNVHILAGNSTVNGGVMIESRAVYGFGNDFKFRDGSTVLVGEDVLTYGVVIKSAYSPVMTYGRDLYFRALSYAPGGGQVTGGSIVLDADEDVVQSGGTMLRYASNGCADILGQKLSQGKAILATSAVNHYDAETTVIGSTEMFRAAADATVFNGNTYTPGIIYASGGLSQPPSGVMTPLIEELNAAYVSWYTGSGATDLPSLLNYHYTEVYASAVRGVADFIEKVGFSCRSSEQCGLGDDFLLSESRWQRIYRHKSYGQLWVEPAVMAPGSSTITRPHPGNERWSLFTGLAQYTDQLWDWDAGVGINRGEDYNTAQEACRLPATPSSVSYVALQNGYLVSQQNI